MEMRRKRFQAVSKMEFPKVANKIYDEMIDFAQYALTNPMQLPMRL